MPERATKTTKFPFFPHRIMEKKIITVQTASCSQLCYFQPKLFDQRTKTVQTADLFFDKKRLMHF
jgi:hypothetical protein